MTDKTTERLHSEVNTGAPANRKTEADQSGQKNFDASITLNPFQ
jgi:hypothetical protein